MHSRVIVLFLGASWLVGCEPPPAAKAPHPEHAQRDRQIGHEQRDLERRRLQLENQVLAELQKLRERRQASTAGEAVSEDEPTECKLLVFGGATHEVFLGCLADEKRPDSVFNMVGEHGSDTSPTSIRNKFAPYGSNYDDTSACNAAATHPPVVVTSDGKSLGLLSSNVSLKRRITAPSVTDWLARMCAY